MNLVSELSGIFQFEEGFNPLSPFEEIERLILDKNLVKAKNQLLKQPEVSARVVKSVKDTRLSKKECEAMSSISEEQWVQVIEQACKDPELLKTAERATREGIRYDELSQEEQYSTKGKILTIFKTAGIVVEAVGAIIGALLTLVIAILGTLVGVAGGVATLGGLLSGAGAVSAGLSIAFTGLGAAMSLSTIIIPLLIASFLVVTSLIATGLPLAIIFLWVKDDRPWHKRQFPYLLDFDQTHRVIMELDNVNQIAAGDNHLYWTKENESKLYYTCLDKEGNPGEVNVLSHNWEAELMTAGGDYLYKKSGNELIRYTLRNAALTDEITIDNDCKARLIAAAHYRVFWLDQDSENLYRGRYEDGRLKASLLDKNCEAVSLAATDRWVIWKDPDNILRIGDFEATGDKLCNVQKFAFNWKRDRITAGSNFLYWVEDNQIKAGVPLKELHRRLPERLLFNTEIRIHPSKKEENQEVCYWEVEDAGKDIGDEIQLWNSTGNQTVWVVEKLKGNTGLVQIRNVHSGKYLGADSEQIKDGVGCSLVHVSDPTSLLYATEDPRNPYRIIFWSAEGHCPIECENGNLGNSTRIQFWNNDMQRTTWRISRV